MDFDLMDAQQTKDSIGRQDTTRTPLFLKFGENVGIEEGPTRIVRTSRLTGGTDVFILGNVNYAVLGTNKLGNTGGTYSAVWELERVINPDNEYHERFKFNEYIDMGQTTATLDLVTNKVK